VTSRDFLGDSGGRGDMDTHTSRRCQACDGTGEERRGRPPGGQRGPPLSSSAGKTPSRHRPGSFSASFLGKRRARGERGDPHKQGGSPECPAQGGLGGFRRLLPAPRTVSPTREGFYYYFSFFSVSFGAAACGRAEGREGGVVCPRLRGEDDVPAPIKRSPRKMVSDMR